MIYGVMGMNGKILIVIMIYLIYRKLNKNSVYLGMNGF